MKIIPITDLSLEALNRIVSEQFGDDTAKTLKLQQTLPSPFLIMGGSKLAGYLKQVEGTIYIPINFSEPLADLEIPLFLRELKFIHNKHHYKYFVLVLRKSLPGFLDALTKYISVEQHFTGVSLICTIVSLTKRISQSPSNSLGKIKVY